MALDPGSAAGQVNEANSKLSEYFSNLRKFVMDDTGETVPPDFKDYVESLDYSELLNMVSARYSDSASFENGAAIENISTMVSILREYGLRNKGKIEYYSDASADYLSESNFYATMNVFWVNMINKNYIEGTTS